MTLTINLPMEPRGQGRHRTFKLPNGMIRQYDDPASRDWKATAQQHMSDAMRGASPLQGPLALQVVAVFTCPRSHWRKRAPLPRRRHVQTPDADNIAKIVKDAGTGVLWIDDCQVCDLHVVKWIGAQGEAPSVTVSVSELAEPVQTLSPSRLLPRAQALALFDELEA